MKKFLYMCCAAPLHMLHDGLVVHGLYESNYFFVHNIDIMIVLLYLKLSYYYHYIYDVARAKIMGKLFILYHDTVYFE